MALISRGPAADNLSAREEHGLRYIARQADHETDLGYGVIGTPSAILIGADGQVLGPLVAGADRIATLAQGLPAQTPLPSTVDSGHRREQLPIEFHSPKPHGTTPRVRAERRSATGVATAVTALSGAAVAASAAPAAAASEPRRARSPASSAL